MVKKENLSLLCQRWQSSQFILFCNHQFFSLIMYEWNVDERKGEKSNPRIQSELFYGWSHQHFSASENWSRIDMQSENWRIQIQIQLYSSQLVVIVLKSPHTTYPTSCKKNISSKSMTWLFWFFIKFGLPKIVTYISALCAEKQIFIYV